MGCFGTDDGTWHIGWALVKGLYFVIASFIFSGIFWWTKTAISPCDKKKKKK